MKQCSLLWVKLEPFDPSKPHNKTHPPPPLLVFIKGDSVSWWWLEEPMALQSHTYRPEWQSWGENEVCTNSPLIKIYFPLLSPPLLYPILSNHFPIPAFLWHSKQGLCNALIWYMKTCTSVVALYSMWNFHNLGWPGFNLTCDLIWMRGKGGLSIYSY